MILTDAQLRAISNTLAAANVVFMPTDTIYGLVGKAKNKAVVERIYHLKGRPPEKPFIILISSFTHLGDLGITMTDTMRSQVTKIWPGPVSVILPSPHPGMAYLHRGLGALAVRWPEDSSLQALLKETGPLIATSANPSGKEPAKSVEEAKAYFGDELAMYIDVGIIQSRPSKLIQLHNDGSFEVLRD